VGHRQRVYPEPALFFDLSRRDEKLDAKLDLLVAIAFELFWPKLNAALVAGGLRTAEAQRKMALFPKWMAG